MSYLLNAAVREVMVEKPQQPDNNVETQKLVLEKLETLHVACYGDSLGHESCLCNTCSMMESLSLGMFIDETWARVKQEQVETKERN